MNVGNIKKVRDAIAAAEARKFNMNSWFTNGSCGYDLLHNCGTAACIGGWTDAIMGEGSKERYLSTNTMDFLGVNEDDGTMLFFTAGGHEYANITQAAAVAVLDRLIETGTVDWDYAMEKAGAKP